MLYVPHLFMLSIWLTCIYGNDVIGKPADSAQLTSTARPLAARNQTKVTRDDQLLSLLAARRRQIIQSRFRTHLKTIVDLSAAKPNASRKNEPAPNATTIHLHLNLSDLLHNAVKSSEEASTGAPSTESNLVGARARKNEHGKENRTRTNMPVIRNILYRRKMSYLNRKLPIDFDQIAFDTLRISEINKGEDLILDNEDSLQVEESSHDKLIYYDVKNNSSKKSMNNFEDVSEESKNVAYKNKTKQNDSKEVTSTTENPATSTNEEIILVFNNTSLPSSTESIVNATYKESEEIAPVLRYGDKIPKRNVTHNQRLKTDDNVSGRHEDEVHEHMDVAVVRPIYENKPPKSLPNQKINVAREYAKNKQLNATQSQSTMPDKKNNALHQRTFSRHRGFRNRTLFVVSKRNGQRQTINLKPNITIASLKPPEDTYKTINPLRDNSTSEIEASNETMDVATATSAPSALEREIKIITNDTLGTESGLSTDKQDSERQLTIETSTSVDKNGSDIKLSTTPPVPTTRILSTAVVTSVSVKSRGNQTGVEEKPETGRNEDEIDATVVATLSNFTSQTYHNNNDTIKTRNPATMYPNITLENSTRKPHNRTRFILRPTNRTEPRSPAGREPTETLDAVEKDVAFTITQLDAVPTDGTKALDNRDPETPAEKTEFRPDLGHQETHAELPIATLFSITDYKRTDARNYTKNIRFAGVETIISRKNESENIENLHAAYILAALGLLPMSLIVLYVIRNLIKRKNKQFEDFEAELHDSDKKSIINPVARLPALVLDSGTKWEFPRSKLRLQTLLGQGNFGQVWKAEADDLKGHIGLTRLVAVKTIKDGAGSKERDDLLRELAIMQKMGSHPNVVTLLGCCTEKEPYLLIMEYVMYGKLLTFLRDHRTRRDYYNFSDDAATLTARDLTVFAYCVARGMEYLATKGIIHRDLAARNILVDHNKLCKIADFGMSRDSITGEVTEPRQPRNALPVRWMAIESLIYSIFTHKTDVWAFGVLLWEIVTLGSSPYANMSGREVMRLVSAGYRLERPNHCRPELYRVMARTWHADPGQRPSFAELRAELAEMLDNTPADGSYVDLESFRADSTVYEIDNCTPRGNYFTVKSRYSEFECDI